MVTVGPGVLGRGLGRSIQGYAVKLASLEGEADDDVAGAPPASGHGKDGGIGDELGVRPGTAVVVAIMLSQDIGRATIKDIDLSSIGGDGTGTGAIGAKGRPGRPGSAKVKRERVRESIRTEWRSDFLVVKVAALAADAVHIAITIEGDAVMIVGLAASIDAGPG